MLQKGDISYLDSNAGSIVLRPVKNALCTYRIIPETNLNVTVHSVPGLVLNEDPNMAEETKLRAIVPITQRPTAKGACQLANLMLMYCGGPADLSTGLSRLH